jgi:hypothetical protein
MGIGEELLEPVRLWSAEAEEHRGISERLRDRQAHREDDRRRGPPTTANVRL